MSWFEYGTLPPKKRKLRKGVWLRVRSLPKSLLAVAKKNRRSALETLDWVIVKEMRPDGKVLLEFWGHTPLLDELVPPLLGSGSEAARPLHHGRTDPGAGSI